MPRRDAPGHDGLRALIQAPQQRCRRRDDDKCHQAGARFGAADCGLKRAIGRLIEARCFTMLGGVTLHHRNRVEYLRCQRAGIGHAILTGPRQPTHAAAKPQRGQHDQHQHAENLSHHPRIGPDQHRQRADAHDGVA